MCFAPPQGDASCRLTAPEIWKLGTGGGPIAADLSVVQLGIGQKFAEPFRQVTQEGTLLLRPGLPGGVGHPLPGLMEGEVVGRFLVEEAQLRYSVALEPLVCHSLLRAAWQIQVARAGGFLTHGTGVAFGDRGVLATGPSGAGKSTLAGFLLEAGGTLLSDEIVSVHPDGKLYGTPFRSTLEIPGSPGPSRLRTVLLLKKGSEESLADVPPSQAVERLLGQVFRPEGGELTLAQTLTRLTQALSGVTVKELTFRKHPDAGHFVKRFVLGISG